MQLLIDFGNTLRKFALAEQNTIIHVEFREPEEETELLEWMEGFNHGKDISSCILSSVINVPASVANFLAERHFFIKLDQFTPLPIHLDYKTPTTLGHDRIASAVAANSMYPDSNVLAINIGTAIIYDFVGKDNIYHGGAISPGIDIRFKGLNQFTDKLPLVEKEEIDYYMGKSTHESILSGVMNGICNEIDGVIDRYNSIYDNLTVILSGGDLNYFDKKLKNNIFALPNLVLVGLSKILEFNEK